MKKWRKKRSQVMYDNQIGPIYIYITINHIISTCTVSHKNRYCII